MFDYMFAIVLMTILVSNALASDGQHTHTPHTLHTPRIITAPKDQNVVTGSVASFVCAAVGDPKPHIEWRKNGKRLLTQKYTVLEIPNGSVLRIEPVTPNGDNATYECLADNGVGDAVRASATLNVLSDNAKRFAANHNGFSDSHSEIKSNSIGDTGIYFSDIPQNDGEGSANGSDEDDDLDQNASGKGFDDEDSDDNIDKGSGDDPLPDADGSDSDILDIGSGEEPILVSSTEKPTKKPDITKKPLLIQKEKEKESRKKETPYRFPTLPIPNKDNRVPDNVPSFTETPDTSTKFFTTTIKSKVSDFDNHDNNKLSNGVSIMGQKQVTPASFFARPGILAAVIGGAVVGLLCAILLVMFIVYRMRKKDEGSYSLDEPKRSTSANLYARGANKEFYA